MARKFNDRLARIILIASVIAGSAWTLYIITVPAVAFTNLQRLDVKWLLLAVGNIGIVAVALLLYSRLYFPRVKRLCMTVNRAIWGVGILLTSFPFALRQISVDTENNKFLLEASAAAAGVDSGTVFITMVVGSYFTTKMYFSIAEKEAVLGKEL